MSEVFMLNLEKAKSEGFTLDLTKQFPTLRNIKLVANWDPHPAYPMDDTRNGFDIDLFAFVLNSTGKLPSGSNVVFYNNKYYPSQANYSVAVPVDNQTGSGTDDEYMLVAVDKLQPTDSKIAVFAVIHESAQRNQHFGMIMGARIEVLDADTNKQLAIFNLTTDHSGDTAVHIGDIVNNSGLTFEPQGVGAVISSANDLVKLYV